MLPLNTAPSVLLIMNNLHENYYLGLLNFLMDDRLKKN